MMAFLAKDRLPMLLERLRNELEVVAPLNTENGPTFCTWTGQPLDLENNTQVPPTEFLLPQRDVLFKYIQDSGHYSFKVAEPKPRLILGLRPCDMKAILVLDRIFGAKPADSLYFSRRRAAILVALNCNRSSEECFCSQVGAGPGCTEGFDLLMTDLDSGYLVESGSPRGAQILREYSEFFQKAEPSHLKEKSRRLEEARKTIASRQERSLDQIRLALEKADWDALGRQCLSCGGCTFVCPICHCFNIVDLGVPDGERMRCRDSCLFSGFSRMAGGANPRKSIGERLKNWYLDKYQYIPENTGLLGCVGCGRCSCVCLAKMDRWRMEVKD